MPSAPFYGVAKPSGGEEKKSMRALRHIALLACALSVPATCANAQSMLEVLAGLKFCRTLKEDAMRLKCFDEALAAKPQQETPNTDIPVAWQITEDKSPIDDSPQVTATLLPAGAGSSVDTPVLVLRCKEKKTEAVFFRSGSYLGSSNSIKVLVRINDTKPVETMWHPSSNGAATFAPAPVQFIRALPDGGKLFIRAHGYGGRSVDGEFSLANVSEARDKISRACNWEAAAKPTKATSSSTPAPEALTTTPPPAGRAKPPATANAAPPQVQRQQQP
jgi:hypothetical protein